jgi:hypothetical protein
MTVEVLGVSEGVVEFAVTGKLTEQDLASAQQSAADVIRGHGKVRILINAEGFDGWEQGGSWDDFSFEEEFDPYIGKMAIVGDRKWEELVLIFSNKAFRQFPIEYFGSSESEQARAWLMS